MKRAISSYEDEEHKKNKEDASKNVQKQEMIHFVSN